MCPQREKYGVSNTDMTRELYRHKYTAQSVEQYGLKAGVRLAFLGLLWASKTAKVYSTLFRGPV